MTRARWEARAAALADHLAAERAVVPGTLLTFAGSVGPAWFVASWAAAKLGAGLAGLPPGPVVALDDALHLDGEPGTVTEPGPRRLSGTTGLPDAVTFSRLGRPVRRRFLPSGVVAIAQTLADLVLRVRAVPGTTVAVCAPAGDPIATFVATVVLVGGGRVVSAPEPGQALTLGATHGAELVALAPGALDTLAQLGAAERDALDLTAVGAVVTGGSGLTTSARDAAEDLFGAETLIDVYATADTGVVAVRDGLAAHHTLLDGVSARVGADGLVEVRSPLAAAPGWVATGDRATLAGDALTLRP